MRVQNDLKAPNVIHVVYCNCNALYNFQHSNISEHFTLTHYLQTNTSKKYRTIESIQCNVMFLCKVCAGTQLKSKSHSQRLARFSSNDLAAVNETVEIGACICIYKQPHSFSKCRRFELNHILNIATAKYAEMFEINYIWFIPIRLVFFC